MSRTIAISALLSVSLLLAPNALAGELHKAARTGNIVAVRALLEKDPQSVNAPNDAGFAPLHLAAAAGQDDVVEFLLKHGATLDQKETGHQRTSIRPAT